MRWAIVFLCVCEHMTRVLNMVYVSEIVSLKKEGWIGISQMKEGCWWSKRTFQAEETAPTRAQK